MINHIKWNIRIFIKKILKQPINIVFVCHRPNVWGSLKTVYESCINDKNFNVTIVAIPNKKQLSDKGLEHNVYETEGAEEFFKNHKCTVINGYNYETKRWFNLKKLKPDYVFFQQPYNICKPQSYQSSKVSKYAKILYVHYASNIIGNGILEDTYPIDFIQDVNTIFVQDKFDKELVETHIKNNNLKTKTILTGFPRYDGLEQYKNIDSNNWNIYPKRDLFRIIWTPRWSTNEGNCNFFEYKDLLLDYAKNNNDTDFIFRPHPQAFLEWAATGELPEEQANKYKKRYESINNAKIDAQKEYLTTFYSSDVLITDISSILAEYFLTGKPIIYCHKKDCFNNFSRKLSKGFYRIHNWEELKQTLDMLKSGNDPLKEKRQEIIKSEFYIPQQGAGYTIKELIKKDFYGKN